MSKDKIKDVAIIGAGPVGLFSIFECGMVGLSCAVIDTLDHIGGQCSALYPEKPIYDIPAHPNILAGDLIQQLETQAQSFKPDYYLGQQVLSVQKQGEYWVLSTSQSNIIQARAIIIAGGAGAFGPNRPPLDTIEQYEGTSIFYMVQRKDDFADKDILIAGGGDSAVDWALSLAPIAKSVGIIHRRDKFRAAPESVRQLYMLADKGGITLYTPYQLYGLQGDQEQLQAVELKGKDGGIKKVQADILLPFYGLSMDLGPIRDWGLGITGNAINIDPTTARTNVDGIYAIGDIAGYQNKLKLILTGFSEAAFAAHAIYKRLNPDTPLHFEYSTTSFKS